MDHTTLTPPRAAELRRIAAGDTRLTSGAPYVPNRARLAWLVRNGYLLPGPRVEPSDRRRQFVRRVYRLTVAGTLALAGGEP